MYWSPNAGSQDEIEQYAPDDLSTIDIVWTLFFLLVALSIRTNHVF